MSDNREAVIVTYGRSPVCKAMKGSFANTHPVEYAAQTIPCIKGLKLNKKKVNPYGGAMALGHPMGATGIFLTCKALDYLQKENGNYALVTMCIGGGMGAAWVRPPFLKC